MLSVAEMTQKEKIHIDHTHPSWKIQQYNFIFSFEQNLRKKELKLELKQLKKFNKLRWIIKNLNTIFSFLDVRPEKKQFQNVCAV